MDRVFDKVLVPVSDMGFDLRLAPLDAEMLDKRAAYLASLGFTRMEIVPELPGYPQMRLIPFGADASGGKHQDYGVQSLLNLPNPNGEAVAAAHRHGLEAVAVYKPYEWGGLWSLPAKSPLLERSNHFPLSYGQIQGVQPFTLRNRALGVRHIDASETGTLPPFSASKVKRLEAVFSMDTVVIDHPVFGDTFPKQSDVNRPFKDGAGPTLWWSADNGCYQKVQNASAEIITEKRTFTNTANQPIESNQRRARVIRWDDLELPEEARFLALNLPGDSRLHVTLPFTMIRGFDCEGNEIPGMSTYRPRNPAEFEPDSATLCDNGFEFEPLQAYFVEPGWRTGNFFAWSGDLPATLKANLSESEPAVHQYWLREVERLINAGFDGVDLRLVCHSASVSRYLEYGYSEGVVEAFSKKHGHKPKAEPEDYLKLMAVRGDFFLDFAEVARERLHANGRFLGLHAHRCYEKPKISGAVNELCFWAAPKVLPDWRRLVALAHEVTLKDYGFGNYAAGDSPLIKEAAHRAGKKVWRHCYHQQGNEFSEEFCRRAQADEAIHGLLLYEIAHRPHTTDLQASGLVGFDEAGELHVNQDLECRIREWTSRYAQK